MSHYLLGDIFAVNTFIIDAVANEGILPDVYHISDLLLDMIKDKRLDYLKSMISKGVLKLEECDEKISTIMSYHSRGLDFEAAVTLFIAKREGLTLIQTNGMMKEAAGKHGIPNKYPDRWDHDTTVVYILSLL